MIKRQAFGYSAYIRSVRKSMTALCPATKMKVTITVTGQSARPQPASTIWLGYELLLKANALSIREVNLTIPHTLGYDPIGAINPGRITRPHEFAVVFFAIAASNSLVVTAGIFAYRFISHLDPPVIRRG
jgi:hypothetical protein